MPIKVTYQDDRGNPIDNPSPQPVTVEDRDTYERAQDAAFGLGMYESDLDKPEGGALLNSFGIDPDKAADIKADIAKKLQEQEDNPKAIPRVGWGNTSMYLNSEQTPRQGFMRYIQYEYQRNNDPEVKYHTDYDSWLANNEEQKKQLDKQWEGFGDPANLITNQGPSGFGSQPGVAASTTPIVADPRVPTRDSVTGKVTPAAPQE